MTPTRMMSELLARGRALLSADPRVPVRVAATVPPCRCAGRCRCAGLVPALLLRQIEQECEFYRRVM